MDTIEIYRSNRGARWGGGWRWRYVAEGNHKRMANGGQGYSSKVEMLGIMSRVCRLSPEEQDWMPFAGFTEGVLFRFKVARLDGTDIIVQEVHS